MDAPSTAPPTLSSAPTLAERWLAVAAPLRQAHGEALAQLAQAFTEGATQGDRERITAVAQGLVDLSIRGEPLAQMVTAAVEWLDSVDATPLATTLHSAIYHALEAAPLSQSQQLAAHQAAVAHYAAIEHQLTEALTPTDLPSQAIAALGLDMLKQELQADGVAVLRRDVHGWTVQRVRGHLPPRLMTEKLTSQVLKPLADASLDGYQITVPMPEEEPLVLLIALPAEPPASSALLERLSTIATLFSRAVERAILREVVSRQARALERPAQDSGELLRGTTRLGSAGMTLDENDILQPLPQPPSVPISTVPGQIVLPLDIRGEMIGKLMLEDERTTDWNEQEIELISVVAERMSQAMEMARLFRDSERRARQLAAASEVSRAATRLLSVDELMQAAVERITRSFNYYHAQVFLVDDSHRWAVLRSSTGEVGQLLLERGHRLEVGSRSIIGYVTERGEPLAARDTDQEQGMWAFNELLPDTRAELAVPLRVGSTIIGALDVQSTSPTDFSDDDVRVLQTLADQMAIAIENARAYEQQKESAEQLREMDKLKSQFLASMSHELRTPLNSIIGFSRVLLKGIDGPISDLQRKDLTTIYTSGQMLLQLIDSILDISKIEAGKMELDFEDVNLLQIIEVALSTAVGLTKDKPVQLLRELPESLPTIRADGVRIRQVLLNLLSNAAKFTESGSIRVTAAQIGDEVAISVSDTGIGIPLEKQEHLYDAFYQVDGSATRRAGGTGLGLAISKSFVEMHGGKIWVVSEGVPGKGTTFTFVLPIAGPQEKVKEQHLPPLVLAVDEEQGVATLYERYLRPEGYRFAACHDPAEATRQAAALQPAVILLDLRMRRHDGLAVLAALQSDILTRDIPVVICTMEDARLVEQKALESGASDFLQKPVMRQHLIAAVRRWAGPVTAEDKAA